MNNLENLVENPVEEFTQWVFSKQDNEFIGKALDLRLCPLSSWLKSKGFENVSTRYEGDFCVITHNNIKYQVPLPLYRFSIILDYRVDLITRNIDAKLCKRCLTLAKGVDHDHG